MLNAVDFEDRVLDIYLTLREFRERTGIDIGGSLTFQDLIRFYKAQRTLCVM